MSGEKATEPRKGFRTTWRAVSLGIEDEPLLVSLLKYRQNKNRVRVPVAEATLISSRTTDGRQMPIIDMDFKHHIVESTTEGHTHIYLDEPISHFRWVVLMCALRFAGVIELGFFVWSLRRGANFVRIPGKVKEGPEETRKATYGWLFRLKEQ